VRHGQGLTPHGVVDDLMPDEDLLRISLVTFDSTAPESLAEWWVRVLDGQVNPIAPPFFVTVTRPEGPGLAFQMVDDPTPGKNLDKRGQFDRPRTGDQPSSVPRWALGRLFV
jgi:glyoxalase superfamily protein